MFLHFVKKYIRLSKNCVAMQTLKFHLDYGFSLHSLLSSIRFLSFSLNRWDLFSFTLTLFLSLVLCIKFNGRIFNIYFFHTLNIHSALPLLNFVRTYRISSWFISCWVRRILNWAFFLHFVKIWIFDAILTLVVAWERCIQFGLTVLRLRWN